MTEANIIFVGNLPYNVSEERMVNVFTQVGSVRSFRLAKDRDGKPRGFGFCEYRDARDAQTALRQLQGYDVDGRGMRLDPAEPPERGPHSRGGKEGNRPDRDEKGRGGYRDDDRGYPDGRAGPSSGDRYDLPPPTGVALPPGASATDAISETLATMPPSKLLDIMTEMKALVKTSPEQARALLNANPQLAYALFQAMLMMNIVDPVVLQRMLAPAQGAPPPLAQPAPFAPAVPPPVAPAPYPYPSAASAVPVIPPPAPVYQAPPPVAAVPPQPVDNQALIQQVLSLSQDTVDSLPPEQRELFNQIRRAALGRR